MQARTVILGLISLLVTCVAAVAYAWWQFQGTLSLHGWIALGLGVGLTMLLAGGLMFLVIYSHERGYDDDAGRPR